jgi:hypothetical protein
MALLAWPIAFGLVLTLLTVFKQQLASMALAPRALVISAVLVSVMAIVVMPLLTVAVSRGRINAAPRVTPRARRRLAAALRRTADRLEPVARKAGLPHEQVRRIVQGDSVAPYFVTVERQGVSPLEVQLLVQAPSKRAAGELASWIAERKRDGSFEATRIRRAARKVSAFPASSFDDADL